MAENFDLIFGQNASQQYAWSDNDYQNGWETIGSIPPTAAQFDALQRRSDTKMKELNDELTPLVNANTTDNRQPSTAYSVGTIKYTPLLPTGWFLECTVGGITSAGEIVLPTTPAEKDTVGDGTVTWTIRKIGSGGDGVPVGAILPFAGNGAIPSGYLLCDGAAYSRTALPDLFAAIGTTYGAGDGSTTFNVPDYNSAERFCQGSTVAGTVKQAGLPNITGSVQDVGGTNTTNRIYFGSHLGEGATGAFGSTQIVASGVPSIDGTTTLKAGYNFTFNASKSNSIYGASNTVQPNAITARYIIKAFDGQTADSALIDITQYAQELAGKANRQLSNLDTANLACHVVVDSYYNSTTGDWYRIYDDGWVEQGGNLASASATVNLLKPMADTNYYISINYKTSVGNSYDLHSITQTTTSFDVNSNGVGHPLCWTVCGMGASA